jgi:hypothetical protein
MDANREGDGSTCRLTTRTGEPPFGGMSDNQNIGRGLLLAVVAPFPVLTNRHIALTSYRTRVRDQRTAHLCVDAIHKFVKCRGIRRCIRHFVAQEANWRIAARTACYKRLINRQILTLDSSGFCIVLPLRKLEVMHLNRWLQVQIASIP